MPKRKRATSKPTVNLSDKSSGQNITQIFTILGLLVVAILGIIILFQSGKLSLPSASTKSTSYTIDGIAVKTTLAQPNVTVALNFLKETIPTTRIPKNLAFQFAEKGNKVKGDSFITNWRQEGMTISLLVGLDAANKSVAYIRIWTMDTAKPLSDTEFAQLPTAVFVKSYLETVGTVSCSKLPAISTKDEATVCPKITSVSDGSLRGITVRSPITLDSSVGTTPPPGTPAHPTVTIISACWVSQTAASTYPDSSCI